MPSDPLSFLDLAVSGVQQLRPYQPGKPESELVREYGVTDIVKLASNESPLGPAPEVVTALREAATGVHRYPDGNGFDLKAALAGRHGVKPEKITLGNGSNDVLDMVARVFLGPGREAVFSRHAFAVYPIATQSAGATSVVAPANSADHAQPYGHDLTAMAARITEKTGVVFVANPNNPTGSWLVESELRAFLDAVPRNVVVVVDEAYKEFAGDCAGYPDASAWLDDYPNLVITRTFSKAYGIAGLRVGYSLSRPDIADLLNRVRHPFNVNAMGQIAALASLAAPEHLQRTVDTVRRERVRLTREIEAMAARVLPSAGNFLCVRTGPRSAEINEELLRRGIIVRPIAGYELPDHLRVTVGLPAENDRFLAALREIAQTGLIGGVA